MFGGVVGFVVLSGVRWPPVRGGGEKEARGLMGHLGIISIGSIHANCC
jgi:hypothetical protein